MSPTRNLRLPNNRGIEAGKRRVDELGKSKKKNAWKNFPSRFGARREAWRSRTRAAKVRGGKKERREGKGRKKERER